MWWIPLIQAGIGLGQAIYSGKQAGKARRQADELQQKQITDNEAFYNRQTANNDAWYNNEYYTDYTRRADSQNLLKKLRETLKYNNNRVDATAAITGATPESMLAAKEQSNRAISDISGDLAAMGAKHKDNIQQTYMYNKSLIDRDYMSRKAGFNKDMYNSLVGKATSHEKGLYNGLTQIGSGINSAFSSYLDKAKTVTP